MLHHRAISCGSSLAPSGAEGAGALEVEKMAKLTITRYCTDDWEAFYINGKIVRQGHKVHRATLLDAIVEAANDLGLDTEINAKYFDPESVEKMGYFPEEI